MTGETVTLLNPASVPDGYGGEAFDWSSPDEQDVHGAIVAPRSSAEPGVAGRPFGVIVGITVYLPRLSVPDDLTVTPHSRFVVRGVTYDVEGEPGDWRSPWSATFGGLEIPLTRAEG